MKEAFSRVAMLLARILAYILSTLAKLKQKLMCVNIRSFKIGGDVSMTDLQIKYQQLEEEKRANRVNEALKSKDIESSSELRGAQVLQVYQNLDKIVAEISKIQADTKLSEAQRSKAIADIVYGGVNSLAKISSEVLGWYKTLSKTEKVADVVKEVAGSKTKSSDKAKSQLWSNE